MPLFNNSDELCAFVREKYGPKVMLSFSGKDSLAAYLKMLKFWKRRDIVCVNLYLVPGLEHEDVAIRKYEKMMGTHIYRLPHPSGYRMLKYMVFQAPENCGIIEREQLPEYDMDDVFAIVVNELKLPQDTYTAVGVSQYDSQNRWASIKKYGAVNEKRGVFYPVYDYKLGDIVEAIRAAGWTLPAYYRLFQRSPDGIDYRFSYYIKQHYPKDYALLKEWFPMIELEVLRMQWREEAWKYG